MDGELFIECAGMTDTIAPRDSIEVTIGREVIENHVEDLFEKFEKQNNLASCLDAIYIIDRFPDFFDPISPEMYDEVADAVLLQLANSQDYRETLPIMERCMNTPSLVNTLNHRVATLYAELPSKRPVPIDRITPYLRAYAATHLKDSADEHNAIAAILASCNPPDSTV